MSEKSAEYLKRTCLICGCHTNQTINIYEPRSGPNIVELIQAKFKFQPLNEDKYLCFSCNNWLINWHSLQALNSNDADESPSGTFRSHINNMVQEKGAGSQRVAVCRPMPRQTTAAQTNAAVPTPTEAVITKNNNNNKKSNTTNNNNSNNNNNNGASHFYSKRDFQRNYRLRCRIQHRTMQTCCVCGRAIVVRMRVTLNSAALKKSLAARCRKCRDVCRWRAVYMQSLARSEHLAHRTKKSTPQIASIKPLQTQLVNAAPQQQQQQHQHQKQSSINDSNQRNVQLNQSQTLQRPRVDGKIVSMLRRLGTTLSREHSTNDATPPPQQPKLPPIMSPAKQKPRWLRPLEDDEILLDFNTTISEVLPCIAAVAAEEVDVGAALVRRQQARRKLTYQVTGAIANDENNVKMELNKILPQGLSVTLV